MLKSARSRVLAGTVLAFAIGAALLAYAFYIEPARLVSANFELKISGWNPAFDGLKVVLISDIHGGSNDVTAEKLSQIVDIANSHEPDLIFLLGDYVSEDHSAPPRSPAVLKMSIEKVATGLAGLSAKFGVFAVLGNHDGAYGDELVAPEFEKLGYRVLQNEVVPIEHNGHRLLILGFKDHLKLSPRWLETSDDAKKLLAAAGDGDIIALQHSPDILPVITGEILISPSLKLVLAGHTHGGQVWLPILGRAIVPSTFGQKYAYGHVKENDVDMFVTSGVGTSMLPLRFMVPPEIAVLTVRSAGN